jgi:hypothetical protein
MADIAIESFPPIPKSINLSDGVFVFGQPPFWENLFGDIF